MLLSNKYPKKPLILVVDDNLENLEILGRILEISGYDIEFADEPLKVYELIKGHKPDMILMDVMMPEMDGYQLTALIKSDEELADIPIIFVTANRDRDGLLEGFNAGGADYIIKPFDTKELLTRIDTHLQLKFAKETIKNHLAELKLANEKLIKTNKEKDNYLEIIHQELKTASDYVMSFLPDSIKQGNIKTDWFYVPTSSLGGDSFGYKYLDDEHFAFYLLDVCGHGISSALHSISILNSINFQDLPNTDYKEPAQVLYQLNLRFQMQDYNDQFFSIFYGVFNLKSGELKYAGGGHPPVVYYRDGCQNNRHSHQLKSQNKIIGFLKDLDFQSDTINFSTATDLYLYTDGAFEFLDTEGRHGQVEDLINMIDNNRYCSGNGELQNIYKDAVIKNGNIPLADDFSILKIQLSKI